MTSLAVCERSRLMVCVSALALLAACAGPTGGPASGSGAVAAKTVESCVERGSSYALATRSCQAAILRIASMSAIETLPPDGPGGSGGPGGPGEPGGPGDAPDDGGSDDASYGLIAINDLALVDGSLLSVGLGRKPGDAPAAIAVGDDGGTYAVLSEHELAALERDGVVTIGGMQVTAPNAITAKVAEIADLAGARTGALVGRTAATDRNGLVEAGNLSVVPTERQSLVDVGVGQTTSDGLVAAQLGGPDAVSAGLGEQDLVSLDRQGDIAIGDREALAANAGTGALAARAAGAGDALGEAMDADSPDSPVDAATERFSAWLTENGRVLANLEATSAQGDATATAALGGNIDDGVGAGLNAAIDAGVDASVGDAVSASVDAAVGDAVSASVDAAVDDAVSASVDAAVGDAVSASVDAAVDDAVSASVDAAVGDAVSASVDASLDDGLDIGVDLGL